MFTTLLLLAALTLSAMPTATGQDRTVSPRPGDTLASVARRYGLGLEHLAYANGVPVSLAPLRADSLVLPGRRILPLDPPRDGLVLNLPERGLYHFRAGQLDAFYPVAVGAPGWCTPTGQLHIANKTVNPTWNPPAWAGVAGPVPPGPANPLGDRWLGLSRRGYGIHATNLPSSIGGAVSHGCIRMYPEHARRLFERVPVGTAVRIEYEPVKIGYADGIVYLTAFPDVYGRVDRLAEARRQLAQAGLSQLAEGARVRDIVARASGRAEPIVGEELTVWIDGQRLAEPVLAVRHRSQLFVPRSLLDRLGLTSGPEQEPLLFGGRWLVPLGPPARQAGLRVTVLPGQLKIVTP